MTKNYIAYNKLIGKNLSKILKDRNISRIDLCKGINISESSLCYYLKGERLPRLDLIVDISDYLKIPIDVLICREKNYKKDYKELSMMLHESINTCSQNEKILLLQFICNNLIGNK